MENLQRKKIDTKTMVLLAIISTISYLMVFIFRIPVVEFLKYEPKDVIIAIAAFIFGPIAAVLISVVVSFLEMVTISTTGPIGLVMNILSTVAFAGVAGAIYKKYKSKTSAIIGLVIGTILMTIVMLLWNYLITPFYMGVPRSAIVDMLLPVFLPFNLIKGGLNTAITILLYKPIVTILRKSKLLPPEEKSNKSSKFSAWQIVICVIAIITIALIIMAMQGII